MTTLAGSLNAPWGVAVDGSENVYVADTMNNRILMIHPGGAVTTLAGSFNFLSALVCDGAGNLYAADGLFIRKIAPGGAVTTFANIGTPSGGGLAIDGAGNIYASTGVDIRKITQAGVVTTLPIKLFEVGTFVAVNKSGTPLYFTDNGGLWSWTPSAKVSLSPPPLFSKAPGLAGVAIDGTGNIYTADSENKVIYKTNQAGVWTVLAGSGVAGDADGTGTAASFRDPGALALDNTGQSLFVTDYMSGTLRKITLSAAPGATLPLVGGRFVVTLSYAGYPPNPLTGQGTGWQLTDNVGYFGTVDATSADVVVKLINFCSLNSSWSVYIGGTTDISTTVSITDTATGRVSQPFVNNLGHDFQLIKAQVFSCP